MNFDDALASVIDKPKLPKGHLSPSQINTYMRCPKQYEYRYVRGIKSPPGVALVQGISVHKGQEHNLEQKIESREDLPVDDVLDAASDAYEDLSEEADFEGEDPGEVKDYTMELVRVQHEGISTKIQPKSVETSYEVQIGNVEYWGRFDVVDDDDTVRDLKTSGRRPPKDDLDGKFQAQSYALVRSMDGFKPHVKYDYVIKNKTPVTDERSKTYEPHHLEATRMTIEGVARAIDAGIFPPHTDGWHCSERWCGYWDMCPAGGGGEVDIYDMAVNANA